MIIDRRFSLSLRMNTDEAMIHRRHSRDSSRLETPSLPICVRCLPHNCVNACTTLSYALLIMYDASCFLYFFQTASASIEIATMPPSATTGEASSSFQIRMRRNCSGPSDTPIFQTRAATPAVNMHAPLAEYTVNFHIAISAKPAGIGCDLPHRRARNAE